MNPFKEQSIPYMNGYFQMFNDPAMLSRRRYGIVYFERSRLCAAMTMPLNCDTIPGYAPF